MRGKWTGCRHCTKGSADSKMRLSLRPFPLLISVGASTRADVAVRRLNGWVNQLTESGGVSEVERCLDTIYDWLDRASDADNQERDHVGECPTTTRQFWAWYYGHVLGLLMVARPIPVDFSA